jgi:hypothetical protein
LVLQKVVSALVAAGVYGGSWGCEAPARPEQSAPLWDIPASTAPLVGAVRFTGTQFVIENRSPAMWHDVEILVGRDGDAPAFRYHADAILGDRSLSIGALNFARPDDMRLNPFRFQPTRWALRATLDDGQRRFVEGRFP